VAQHVLKHKLTRQKSATSELHWLAEIDLKKSNLFYSLTPGVLNIFYELSQITEDKLKPSDGQPKLVNTMDIFSTQETYIRKLGLNTISITNDVP
jgi:hypothetical protein